MKENQKNILGAIAVDPEYQNNSFGKFFYQDQKHMLLKINLRI